MKTRVALIGALVAAGTLLIVPQRMMIAPGAGHAAAPPLRIFLRRAKAPPAKALRRRSAPDVVRMI